MKAFYPLLNPTLYPPYAGELVNPYMMRVAELVGEGLGLADAELQAQREEGEE